MALNGIGFPAHQSVNLTRVAGGGLPRSLFERSDRMVCSVQRLRKSNDRCLVRSVNARANCPQQSKCVVLSSWDLA